MLPFLLVEASMSVDTADTQQQQISINVKLRPKAELPPPGKTISRQSSRKTTRRLERRRRISMTTLAEEMDLEII